MPERTVTESIHIIRMMLRAARAAGVDTDAALSEISLDKAVLEDPDARVPMHLEQQLWDVLVARSGDPCFGLHAGTALEAGEFDVMDYAIRTSDTLRQALLNAKRYNRLLHDVAEFELRVEGRSASFEHYFRDDPRGANWQAGDFTLASVYSVAVAITGQSFTLRGVHFQHAAPADITPYQQVFQCRPSFERSRNRLLFDAAVLHYPVLGGDPQLHKVLVRHADAMLAKLPDTDSVVDQVRYRVSHALRDGEPSIGAIAQDLNMTHRTLQRRLSASGTTFKDIVDALRKSTAERYLTESAFGVSEIAYLLGYSEPSAFHRAFRRWFDQSPVQYRERFADAAR